ncbi:MAG: hypothetical protein MZV65_20640 [Chromatiales bacterium]|nr:hypothetical protein [Chromatiales bacterium]
MAKYFAIIPAMFVGRPTRRCSALERHAARTRPQSAILSAVIFNALVIVGADPAGAARRRATGRSARGALLRRNLLIYGLGGARGCRSSASSSSILVLAW